jgi:hypothetical protein
MLGVHTIGGHLATLSGTERFQVVVTRDGDRAAKDEESGVEIVAMVGYFQIWRQAGVDDAETVASQFGFEFETIH